MKNKVPLTNNNKLKKFFTYTILITIPLSYISGLIMSFWYMFNFDTLEPFVQMLIPALLNIVLLLSAFYIAKKYTNIQTKNKIDSLYAISKVLLVFSAVSLIVLMPLTSLTYSLVNDLFIQNIQPSDDFNHVSTYLFTDLFNIFLAGAVGLLFSYIFIKLENQK